jgi:hypothetical protein
MSKKTAILILGLLSYATLCTGAPLRDGFGLNGIDGKLISSGDKWLFEFDSAVSDEIGRIKAGAAVELLPSTALEKITADAEKHSGANYRLWGNVTKYKGGNFIFPIYFLPVSPAEEPAEAKESSEDKIAINEPNDTLAIPEEIVKKLKSRRVLRQEEIKDGMQLKQDYVLTDRTALLDKGSDDKPMIVLDAIGRNIPTISFRLLPCEVLERAQREQSVEADPVRFKIAGILTQYKGTYYLLLQKATRAYGHENFGG